MTASLCHPRAVDIGSVPDIDIDEIGFVSFGTVRIDVGRGCC